MKIHRFWLDQIPEQPESILTQPELIHQVKDVLKLQPGELIQLFNAGEERQAELLLVTQQQIKIRLEKNITLQSKPIQLHLAVSLLKGDGWDEIIRSCVALGIADIQPLVCDRSIVRELSQAKMQRYHAIAKETVEQSGWNTIPTILPVQPFTTWVESANPTHTFLLHHPAPSAHTQHFPQEVTVVVGPEGGWTEAELSLAQRHHIQLVSVSPATLTARLAPVVGCTTAFILASQK